MPVCELNEPFASLWRNKEPFAAVAALQGEEFRKVKNRRTFRVEINSQGFFVKYHSGTSLREIIKNLLQFKLPVTGADVEVKALEKLRALRIPTMQTAAYGWRNNNPLRRESFIITPEITDALSLEDMVEKGFPPALRREIIRQLAAMMKTMHGSGMNHRDCYLCHFLWQEKTQTLFVIDLHRAQIRKKVPRHYLVKDIAGLLFSALDMPLRRRDVWYFIRIYTGKNLHDELTVNGKFWDSVLRTALKLYRKEFGKEPENFPF